MKKIEIKMALLIVVFTTFMITSGRAQQADNGIYIKVHAGYSLFSPGGDPLLSSPGYLYAPTGQLLTLTSNTRSGEGLNLGFGVEKEMGKVLILGLDINYLDGKNFSSVGTMNDGGSAAIRSSWNATGTQSVWSAVPSISFKLLPQTNYYVYTRIGLIMGFDTKYHDNESFITTQSYKEIDDYNYGLNAGVQAALGVQFKLQGNLRGFAEINNNFMDASPSSVRDQSYISGIGGSNQAQLYDKRYTYIKANSGNSNFNNTTNMYSIPSIVQHFNSAVLNIGLAFAIK
jgi:hypothetical protein